MAARNEDSPRERARRRAREQRRQVIRRRRLAAAVVGLLLVLLVLLATSAFGGDSGKPKRAQDQLKPLAAPPDSAAAAHGRGIRAVDSVLTYTPYVSRGTPNQRLVALTFDDGPGPLTPQFLKTLRDNHAPATFFVIAQQLKDFGDATRQAVRDGFEVGDHTVNHRMLAPLGRGDQEHEIVDGARQMRDAGIPPPQLFRPPGNSFNDTTVDILRRQHLLMVLWDVDTEDYKLPGTPAIVRSVLTQAKPGSIVLMHDGGGDRSQTLAAVPRSSRGYELGASSSSRCPSWCSRIRRRATSRAPTKRPARQTAGRLVRTPGHARAMVRFISTAKICLSAGMFALLAAWIGPGSSRSAGSTGG